MLPDFGFDRVRLKMRQRLAPRERDLHQHDGGRFARIVDEIDPALPGPVLERQAARRIREGPGRISRRFQTLPGHPHAPDPDANGGEQCQKAQEDVHSRKIAPSELRRHENRRAEEWRPTVAQLLAPPPNRPRMNRQAPAKASGISTKPFLRKRSSIAISPVFLRTATPAPP